ncbi:hypothetical protein BFP70_05930 [Thioclava sp. SK-1]|uniref:IclR family transcriptional regulator n=1 Tax=Thioclava sp. SK-1 TaxID=1889770 RepID=UPI000826302E|nr:IclR family transcriptional regulator [Thioclava sp. SK-1]OCX66240.1 hypothetical protein BFP70_05930 [Thioclava sp. SK-1]
MPDISDKQHGIKVIRRAAAVLRVIRDAPGGLSLGQIAMKLDLPRSTVQRLIRALQSEGMVAWSSINGGIVLGPEMRALAEASRYDIVAELRIVLQDLAHSTAETVDLSVLREDGMILLDQIPGPHRLRTVTPIGEVFPLTRSANGRAALALLDEHMLLRLLRASGQLTRPGQVQRLFAELRDTRASGIAHDLDDHTDGICAVGIAFRDRHGDVYSISVPVPRSRYDRLRPVVERELLLARATVERLLNSTKHN